ARDTGTSTVVPLGTPIAKMREERSLVIIDGRALGRQCLTQSLRSSAIRLNVIAVESIDEWRSEEVNHAPPAAALVNVGARKITDRDIGDDIAELVSSFHPAPVVVLADHDELAQILKA